MSSAVNSIVDSVNIDKQIKAQAAENQKTREYNLNLAKLQNQWNIDQWNRANDYNSPENQMRLFASAGLNPDLMYGRGTSGMTAATSPAMTSGAPAIAQDMSPIGRKRFIASAIDEGVQSFLDTEMKQAQIDAIRANADKTREETGNIIVAREGMSIDNYVKALTAGNTIELSAVNLQIARGQEKLTEKELEQMAVDIANAQKQGELLDANKAQVAAQTRLLDQEHQQNLMRFLWEQNEERRRQEAHDMDMSVKAMGLKMSQQQFEQCAYRWQLEKAGIDAHLVPNERDAELNNAYSEFQDWLDRGAEKIGGPKFAKVTRFLTNGASWLCEKAGEFFSDHPDYLLPNKNEKTNFTTKNTTINNYGPSKRK